MAVNLLISYAFHDKVDMAALRRRMVCGKIMVDSGAFTAHTTGKPVSLDAYAEYLEQWSGCWDHAVTLDVIGDPLATAANTRKLHERGLPVMPVFTRGGSLADFDAMVADVGYVCVGGMVGAPVKAQRARVGMLQRRAAEAGGGIHALGVGSLTALRAARPYSADASSVSSAFRNGTIGYFDGRYMRFAPITKLDQLRRDREHIRDHGIDLAYVVKHGRLPSVHGNGREELMQAMSLAYACADEHLKDFCDVPPPTGVATAGVNLYNSVSTSDLPAASGLDRLLHGTQLYSAIPAGPYLGYASKLDADIHGEGYHAPPLWRRYLARHSTRCRAEGARA